MEAGDDIPDLLAAVDAHGVEEVHWVDADGRPPPPGPVVTHPHRRLLLAVAGCHRIELPGGERLDLRLGSAVVFAPGAWHRIASRAARSYVSARCSDRDLSFFRRHHDGVHEPGELRHWVRPPDARILQLFAILESVQPDDRVVLVERPELPVAEVGRSCGHGDARYFRRMFRRRFGVPPSRMRDGG